MHSPDSFCFTFSFGMHKHTEHTHITHTKPLCVMKRRKKKKNALEFMRILFDTRFCWVRNKKNTNAEHESVHLQKCFATFSGHWPHEQ